MIRTIVATKRGQGARPDDFSWVDEDELVIFPLECDRDRGRADGGCGCARSFAGLTSRCSTTTAKVADLDMSRDQYIDAILASMTGAGWTTYTRADAEADAEELLGMFSDWTVDTVVEKRGTTIQNRRV